MLTRCVLLLCVCGGGLYVNHVCAAAVCVGGHCVVWWPGEGEGDQGWFGFGNICRLNVQEFRFLARANTARYVQVAVSMDLEDGMCACVCVCARRWRCPWTWMRCMTSWKARGWTSRKQVRACVCACAHVFALHLLAC